MDQTSEAFNKRIDFTNLNQEIIEVTISTDDSGVPVIGTQYKSNLKTRVLGHSCINATNLSNGLNTPISQPFITFTQNATLVNINKVTGLQPNERYKLVLISFGQSFA